MQAHTQASKRTSKDEQAMVDALTALSGEAMIVDIFLPKLGEKAAAAD